MGLLMVLRAVGQSVYPTPYTFGTLAGSAGNLGAVNGTGGAARFNQPQGIAVDSAGNVYVAEFMNHTIRKITPSGEVATLAGLAENPGSVDGNGSAARFFNPTGVAVDGEGNVFVADNSNHTIRKITPGGDVSTLAGRARNIGSADGPGIVARFNFPFAVAVDAVGRVYVSDSENHTIRRIEVDGTVATLAGQAGAIGLVDGVGDAARFNFPYGLAVNAAGVVYVSESGNQTVRRITGAGAVTTLAGSAGTFGTADGVGAAAEFLRPQGLALDGAGNLYIADISMHTIRKMTPGGVVTTLAGVPRVVGSSDGTGSGARFNFPTGLAVDGAGLVYVADCFNHTVRKGGDFVAPVITTHPFGHTVVGGSFVRLRVNADGRPPLAYQWQFNGGALGGETNAVLTLPAVGLAQVGVYAVVVTQGDGASVTSSNASVRVAAAGEAVPLSVQGGDTGQFEAVGGGTMPWRVGLQDTLVVTPGLGSIQTTQRFGDFVLHAEFRTPVPSDVAAGDSGIVLQGRYEVQIRDSFGVVVPGTNDCGAIWNAVAPRTNACLPPGAWQTLDIWFRSAQWNGATKVAPALVTVVLNGVTVQSSVAIVGPTPGGAVELPTSGPIVLRDNGSPVEFRNLSVTPLDFAPEFVWARRAGGPDIVGGAEDAARRVKLDAAGNVYVAGSFSGTAAFGATNVTSAGGTDGYVAKFDPAGAVVWVVTMGGAGADELTDLAVDGSGGVVVTGSFTGAAGMGTNTIAGLGGTDVLVGRLDGAGGVVWLQAAGGLGNDVGASVDRDEAGNIFVTGQFAGSASFGTTNLNSSGGLDVFLAKYDGSGALQWVRAAGAPGGDDVGRGVVADGVGGAVVAGSISGVARFGGSVLPAVGASDAFVAHFGSGGIVQWAVQSIGVGSESAYSVARDVAGNVFIAGTFSGSAQFGTNVLVSAGGRDLFVAGLGTNGAFLWVRQAGGTGDDGALSGGVAVDVAGNVYLAGGVSGGGSFSASPVPGRGGVDGVVAKYDEVGNLLWVRSAGGAGADQSRGIAADGSGSVVAVGAFAGTAGFEPLTLTSVGAEDIFVARLAAVPPVIVTEPVSQGVAVGQAVTNAVVARGTSGLRYQWSRNGTNLVGATNATLVLPGVTAGQTGSYRVLVWDRLGASLSAAAVVTIQVPGAPVVSAQPADQMVSEGGVATFAVAASGNAPLGYQWWLNGNPIGDATNSSYRTPVLGGADGGVYSVVVSNGLGVARSRDALLTVYPVPRIDQALVSQRVASGDAVTFSVTASGTGLQYAWIFGGGFVPGATNATLTIPAARLANGGDYLVVVSNPTGLAETSQATLTVDPVPVIRVQPQARTVPIGNAVTFAVTAAGEPPLRYQWRFQGTNLTGETNVTLSLSGAGLGSAGDYSVAVANAFLSGGVVSSNATLTVLATIARLWNEQILAAIRIDSPHPPVQARNLFHFAVAVYDAWAAYDSVGAGYLYRGKHSSGDIAAARQEAISYAAYRVLSERFARSRSAATTQAVLEAQMASLGFDRNNVSLDTATPAGVGNSVAAAIAAFSRDDGARQDVGYADLPVGQGGYVATNQPMVVATAGTTVVDANHWQPLSIANALDQNGFPVASVQTFQGVQWLGVRPFALDRADGARPWIDPGPPPRLGGLGDARFRAEVVEVIRYSSQLTPDDGVMVDISPGATGNNSLGTNDGAGHPVNPATGQAYAANLVKRGDFGRVLAEYWADGPRSETPPGHWNVIANSVGDSPGFVRRVGGTGPVLEALEWDVKVYLALNAAVHEAACAAWSLKRFYNGGRPITFIRHMGGLGQSSDPLGAAYHPDGLPLVPGLIELVTAVTAQAGGRHAGLPVSAVAILAWPGQQGNSATQHGGARWILATQWVPFQQASFVTPGFPGYVSGHSTFSRSAAEVLAAMTGSEFFPGGLSGKTIGALAFENGPSQPVTLQWATYFDAADQAGISRLFGGIHVPVDDFTGRIVGAQCGRGVWGLVQKYFDGSALRQGVRLTIVRLPGGNHELRWDVLRGMFYRLQSATELGGVFGDEPGGLLQATDARTMWRESGGGNRRFYRVLTLPTP